MFNKVVALSALAVGTQAVTLMEPDHIAIALAESLSSSAQHLVQMAAASEVEAAVQPEPVVEAAAEPQLTQVDAEADAEVETKTKTEEVPKAKGGDYNKLPW